MTYFVKMGYKMGFTHLFVTAIDGVGVLQSPFPTHDWKLGTEIDGIDDIGTQIKWWKVLYGGDLFRLYSEIAAGRLSDMIVAQFIIWELRQTSIKGTHSIYITWYYWAVHIIYIT